MTEVVTPAVHRMPRLLGGFAAASIFLRFARDPLGAVIWTHRAYGRFVVIPNPLPVFKLRGGVALVVGGAFSREILSDPDTWRTVNIGPGGPFGSAARRMSYGIIRMSGRKHAYYRRLLVPPLSRSSVCARGNDMARLASEEVSSWPLDKVIDLGLKVRRLVRTLAVGLLFGNDRQRAFPIIELLSKALDYNWSLSVLACPIDLPFTPYGKMLRGGEALERRILEWANCVRGRPDPQNLMSIIVNNPTETGSKLTAEEIVEQMPTLIGATYETCQNAVIWTLILLVQHPRIAQELYEELHHKLAGDTATLDKIEELPLLDAVIKESMRLLPPVPNQFRVAERDAKLAGYETPKGLRVLLSVFLTNREPELYYDSDRFLPRRWQTITPTPFEYSVFGGGLHGCPGFWFGLGVVKVALATILVHHRVVLLPQTINYKVRVNLSPCGPVRAVLHHHGAPFLSAALRGGLTKLVRL